METIKIPEVLTPELKNKIISTVNKQKNFFKTGKTFPLDFRKKQLYKLLNAIKDNEQLIYEALKKDLNKSLFESYISEVGFTISEIKHTIKNLRKWARKKRGFMSLAHFFSSYEIENIPRGNTLIIAPWNYPFQLLIAPLIGAIAGGNTAILKPSEIAPNVSNALRKIINKTFPEEYITVIEGGIEINKYLLTFDYDLIFYTGSTRVGKIIMSEASKHLTPVLLELGGKSPTIVSKSAKSFLEIAATRIVWGKFMNAGQTCVAPDYLVVHSSILDETIKLIKQKVREFYGENPKNSKDYGRIINKKHFSRLISYLKDTEIIFGGHYEEKELYIEPTLILSPDLSQPVMQDEIFGPILPIFTYNSYEEIIKITEKNPFPLALYYFGKDKKEEKFILRNIRFGGGAINDTLIHLAEHNIPFGGIRTSGIGAYHGKYTFEAFTHKRGLARKTHLFDLPFRYPPANDKKLKIVKFFLG